MSEHKETHSLFFQTPIWSTEKPEWVKETNKACQPYLDEAHQKHSEKIKKNKGNDFGLVYHSTDIGYDPKLKNLSNYIRSTAFNLFDSWGYNLTDHSILYESMWVQEFAKDGGGHHRVHIHENCHMSGFYFLINENSSYPLFHDPRSGACMTALPQKDERKITPATRVCNYQPKAGSLYMFPSYLPHEYIVSRGGKFRFIHFNLRVIPNYMLNSKEGGIA
tara:strand:+ start:146 stop:805 length:660 start_codon:yes stop_codon:yes gene_type:complete